MSPASANVLIVEDDPGVRVILERIVTRLGMIAHSVAGGAEGLEVAAQMRPDLVILDLMMPGMNGFQFLRAYREGGAADTPVIIVTAKDDTFDQFWARKLGVHHYFVKPISPQALSRAVEAELGRSSADKPQAPSATS